MHEYPTEYTNSYLHCYGIESVLATCGYPSFGNEDSGFQITGYSDPAVEGRNVSIRCPPGMIHTGPSTLVCTAMEMENGSQTLGRWLVFIQQAQLLWITLVL